MKKALAMLLFAAMLSGCGPAAVTKRDYSKSVRETLARSYTMTADIAYGEDTAKAEIAKSGATDITVSFSEPETLSGLMIITSGETVKALYRGVELDLSAYGIPSQSIISVLNTVLAGEGQDNIETSMADGVITARGSVVIASYEMDFDSDTMAIKEIRVPSADGRITVTDFKFDD